jgi:hypothetical protein
MLTKNLRDKAAAFAIHFSFSLIVISCFIAVIYFSWYPEPFFTASGGLQGLKIVILVDLVLGPLLTFIVFNKTKRLKEKLLDFSVIISIQLAALIWGALTVYHQRPIAIVFWENKFYTVPDNALSNDYKSDITYQKLISEKNIPFIYAKKPESVEDIQAMLARVEQKKLVPFHQVELFAPFDSALPTLKSSSIDIKEIISQNENMKNNLNKILNKTGTAVEDNIYVPLESRYQNLVLIFDPAGENLGYLKAPSKPDP